MLVIREATASDAPLIVQMIREANRRSSFVPRCFPSTDLKWSL